MARQRDNKGRFIKQDTDLPADSGSSVWKAELREDVIKEFEQERRDSFNALLVIMGALVIAIIYFVIKK